MTPPRKRLWKALLEGSWLVNLGQNTILGGYKGLGFPFKGSIGLGFRGLGVRGSYKWGYKSSNMGFQYSYPTYNPTYNHP